MYGYQLSEIEHLPACPAVYQVKTKDGKILYVGSTSNLKKRWIAHHVLARLIPYKIETLRVFWYETENYRDYEAKWLKHLKPPLNIRMAC
jgi:excinuclease UvrABC nuclease subunit